MTISVTTISNNQTFGTWLTTTNRLADIVTQNTVTSDATTGGSVTTGNSFVNGHFGSNFLYVANTLSGGNVSSNGVLRVQANVAVFTGSSNLLVVTANGTTTAVSLSSNTISLAAQNNVAISGALLSVTSTNTTFSGLVDIGNTSSNVSISGGTLTINGTNVNTAITSNATTAYTNATSFASNASNITSGTLDTGRLSGTYNITANNATNLNGQPSSYYAHFPSGTAMLFVQNTAPTGWTKSTTHDNKALRVVSGTAGSGGSVAFTTAFASQSVTGTVGSTTLTANQIPSHTHTGTTDSGGSHNHTGTTDSGGSHNHTIPNLRTDGGSSGSSVQNAGESQLFPTQDLTTTTAGAHTHTFTTSTASAHTHTFTTGSTGGGQGHDHTFTGTAINLAVQYVDVIIATKD